MKKITVILFCVSFVFSVRAQVSSYFCGFEDAAENAQWQLNTPKNENAVWKNLWYIGTAEAYEGQNSIYISDDGGQNATFTPVSNIMIAWRELTLAAGDYDIAIDWKCLGDSNMMNLRLAWVPDDGTYFDDMWCGMNSEMNGRDWATKNTLTFLNGQFLSSNSTWTHSTAHFTNDGKAHRLVLIWLCNGAAARKNPAACVDNIQICRNNCGKPTNLTSTATGQVATLTWESTAQEFNLRLHRIPDGEVTMVQGIKNTSAALTLPYGAYEPYMQVICNQDTSIWYSMPVFFVFNSEGFNYLDLTDDRCFYSAETPSDWHDVDNPGILTPGRIDYGYASILSRHTIHYHPDELDARTYNSVDAFGNPVPPLRVVPDGELASVRIGSWELAARVSRVVYEFEVDTVKTGTLMVKYAIVLQMSGHEESARPRFTLKIIDAETGEELNDCTTADLSAKTGAEGWYNVPINGDVTSDQTVCWRDWTTVGMNLNAYQGRKVKVLLTAFGCTASIHYGYAYFTATCSTGMIEGIQCGDTPTEQFIAPEGFNYRWYLKSQPSKTLSTERIYDVDYTDDREYGVDVTYKTNSDCGFTLSACAIPRYPIPDATFSVFQKDCKNYIRFTNNSHIRTRNLKTGEVIETANRPEAILWDFQDVMPATVLQDSGQWNPEFELPSQEADYRFSLKAIVGQCDSTQYFDVHVNRAMPDSVVENVLWCEGQPYRDDKGRTFLKDTIVIDRGYRNQADCDSIHTLCIRFISAIRDTTNAEITEGQSYEWQNKTYTQSVFDSVAFTLPTGCDSVKYLSLKVNGQLSVELQSVSSPCPEDDSLYVYLYVRAGEPDWYNLTFDETGHNVGWTDQQDSVKGSLDLIAVPTPESVKPGWYPLTIRITSAKNGEVTLSAESMVRYSSSILQQRWDDVIGILNKDNNGGYEFVSFQWYKDDKPIEGAVYPYLYEPDKLTNSDYSVMLVQEGQTKGVMTCPFTPVLTQPANEQTDNSKFFRDGQLFIRYNNQVYNAQGQPVSIVE